MEKDPSYHSRESSVKFHHVDVVSYEMMTDKVTAWDSVAEHNEDI